MCSSCRRASAWSAAKSAGSATPRGSVAEKVSDTIFLAQALAVGRARERVDDARPRAREIAPVVAASAHREHTPARVALGERTQAPRGVRVGFLGVAKMRDRVAAERIRAALEQHELGF